MTRPADPACLQVPPEQPVAAMPLEWPATGLASVKSVSELSRLVEAIERRYRIHTADTELSLVEVAVELRISAKTLRRWLKSGRDVKEKRLHRLMSKNAMGRWCSTRRKVAAWKEEIANRWTVLLWPGLCGDGRAGAQKTTRPAGGAAGRKGERP